jgi:putative membrane protein insertion efficiency factor
MQGDPAVPEAPGVPGLAQRGILALIRAYQLFLSPLYAGSCRFVPSCSVYASDAVRHYGALRGGALAVRRLLRCRPFGGHGFDPAYAPSELGRRRDGIGAPNEPFAETEFRGDSIPSCNTNL